MSRPLSAMFERNMQLVMEMFICSALYSVLDCVCDGDEQSM